MNWKSRLLLFFLFSVGMMFRSLTLPFSCLSQTSEINFQQNLMSFRLTAKKSFESSPNTVIQKWRSQVRNYKQSDSKPLLLETLQNDRKLFFQEKSNQALDIYKVFIELKKSERLNTSTSLEKHHIKPRFEGGETDTSNLIALTTDEHTLAHLIRFFEYGKSEDAAAVLFRCNSNEEARRVTQRRALEKMKEEKKGRWNSELQSELGKRGGPKGGSANTSSQFEARQKVGNQYGQQNGLKNQGLVLKNLVKKELKWIHELYPETTFVTTPCNSGKELIQQLENFIPSQIKNESSFYKIFHGERPRMYGWKLVDKGIRSEAEEGKDAKL